MCLKPNNYAEREIASQIFLFTENKICRAKIDAETLYGLRSFPNGKAKCNLRERKCL
jgi:hypothetical protein